MIKLWQWIIGRTRHSWTPWEIHERKSEGLAMAFGATTQYQTRFCQTCGLSQETGLSVYTSVECEEMR